MGATNLEPSGKTQLSGNFAITPCYVKNGVIDDYDVVTEETFETLEQAKKYIAKRG